MGALPLFASKTPVKNVFRYKLKNGLELFVMENDAAPLAYIEIAVRAGGVTQTAESAGLFHLYEHMMFKGNAKYANQAAVQDSLNEMGVSNWNGSTGVDRVNYYFTIPAGLLRQGLEFWSYAIRTPLLDENELKNEKEVVLSEIGADSSDPAHIFPAFLAKTLYADSPWQLDPSGIPQTVRDASVEQLRTIQKTYYVPNNAALFVGGDVHHKEVYKLVQEIYGSWEKGENLPAIQLPAKAPFEATRRFVYPDPRSSGSYLQAALYLRGPDGELDAADTYAADIWSNMLSDPSGYFADTLTKDPLLRIPDPDYTGGSYLTRRAAGIISLSAAMLTGANPVAQAEHFLEKLKQFCDRDFSDTTRFLQDSAIAKSKRQKEDENIYAQESAVGLLSALSYMWAACGSNYFFDYTRQFEQVKAADIQAFVATYLRQKPGMYVVFVSPDGYSVHKNAFQSAGYEEITPENAFWWRKDGKSLPSEKGANK